MHSVIVNVAGDEVLCLFNSVGRGGDDYLKMREQLFTGETVTTLYQKIQAY